MSVIRGSNLYHAKLPFHNELTESTLLPIATALANACRQITLYDKHFSFQGTDNCHQEGKLEVNR